MKAKKLPSGSWRCRPYLGIDENGKQIRESITVDDPTPRGRRLCERMADDLKDRYQDQRDNPTVMDTILKYIEIKSRSLSPSTLRSYRSMAANAYTMIQDVRVLSARSDTFQRWLDDYKRNHSPKTSANAAGLLASAVRYYDPNIPIALRLPERAEKEYVTPTDQDVQALLKGSKGTELEKAILLAAFGTLRRSEVCALTKDDIQGEYVSVSKAMVWTGAEWAIKSPKTASSVRTVKIPKEVLSSLRTKNTRIVDLNPSQLSAQFDRLITALNLPRFRFHDLRAYSASIRHALGIPDQYIMMDGGWKTDAVLKRIYRRTMEDKRNQFSDRVNAHFSELLDTKVDTKRKKRVK